MSTALDPAPQPTRIALVAETARSIVRLRRDLLLDLVRQGQRPLCLTGPASEKEARHLRELGADHQSINFDGAELPIVGGWQLEAELGDILAKWAPSSVLAFGTRALSSAAPAARRAKISRIVSVVTGLGPDGVTGSTRRFASALRASDVVVFHNSDDRRTLEEQGLLPEGLPSRILPGAGVDVRRTTSQPLPPSGDTIVFLMLSRLEEQRGVLEFAAAARAMKARHPALRFRLAGPESRAHGAISAAAVVKASAKAIEYLGDLDDVRPALTACHVLVYPSRGEGMPRAVLEALATGRPAITTDTPGCRDTVDDRVSGCLIPPADPAALEAAMETFVRLKHLTPAMSRAARLKAERRFDSALVNREMLALLRPS